VSEEMVSQAPIRVACIAAVRPNFMKVKPVVDALERAGAQVVLVHTGQHYDRTMSDVFFEDIQLRQPDIHLGIGSGTQATQVGRVMIAAEPVFASLQPDVVIVVGDVNATVACAYVAAQAGHLVGHVEAGLRSRDWSMPEEINRVVTDAVADLLFAPSEDAVANLLAEGVHADRIVLSGNVMIDTLLANLQRAVGRPILDELGVAQGGYALVTMHRPANVDDVGMLDQLLDILGNLPKRLPIVFPVHPRTAARLTGRRLPASIVTTPPLGYLDFLCLEASAKVVLTDSGGIQEETTALGVPCLTLRDNTERPITITEGTNRLVGRDRASVLDAVDDVLANGVTPRCPALWDGHAGIRIADAIVAAVTSTHVRRPTEC
jgi:UDP-N-acetylglucosamine 2-epimerase (non-hydrolysing)